MGKSNLLSSSIKNLKINEPFALKGQKELKWKPPQNEVPQIERPKNEQPRFEGGGFFKVSHSIFEQPVIRRISGDCFRLYLWMSSLAWRFPDSDGTIHAAISFIVQKTGISHASASRGLQYLKDQNLIELVRVDFKKGNLWRVVPPFEPPQKKVPQSELAQNVEEAASKRASTSLKMREQLPHFEGHNKNLQEIQKHPTLHTYFASLRPFGKREREWDFFLKLSKDFKTQEIDDALAWIQNHGVGEQNQPCHSPMAYLSQAMASVLEQANTAKTKAAQMHLNQERLNRKIHEQTQEEINHEKERKEKEQAFIQKYPHPAEQEKIINQLSKSNTWIQTRELKRAWAINQWWQNRLRATG